jgi:hypothetical protein
MGAGGGSAASGGGSASRPWQTARSRPVDARRHLTRDRAQSNDMLRRALLGIGLAVLACMSVLGRAYAQDARQRLYLVQEQIEEKLKTTRWDFNHLADKKQLEAELVELGKIIEAVQFYESQLRCPNYPGSLGSAATDREVALIANIVHLRGFVNDASKWNYNNVSDQKKMKEDIARSEAMLAELRAQHCGG